MGMSPRQRSCVFFVCFSLLFAACGSEQSGNTPCSTSAQCDDQDPCTQDSCDAGTCKSVIVLGLECEDEVDAFGVGLRHVQHREVIDDYLDPLSSHKPRSAQAGSGLRPEFQLDLDLAERKARQKAVRTYGESRGHVSDLRELLRLEEDVEHGAELLRLRPQRVR